MADFDTSHVKNIVLLGHAGSGKTTLGECMLYEAGIITRRGSIAERNTVADYHDLEQERGNSVFSKLLHSKWRGYKINIIDTPGYDDFVGEVISALRVADTGVMLINASRGVEVGTDIIWDYTEQFKTPMIFAVNKLDEETADFDKAVAEAKAHFGSNITVVQYPRQQGAGFHEIIDVLRMTMYKFKDGGGKPEKLPIPDDEKERADKLHKELIEAVAGNDETLMEKYFDKGELDEDEIKAGMKKAMINHDLFPLFCLSAERNMGSGRLMGFIDNVCPSANEMPPQKTKAGTTLTCDANGPACIFIYKTVSEPHEGELSFFKVYSGTIKSGMELVNETTGVSEKISQLFVVEGNKRTQVNELTAGDIGATLKLRNTHVNNTLHEKGKDIKVVERLGFSKCKVSVATPKDFNYTSVKDLEGKRIATSYPNTVNQFFASKGVNVDLHQISGSVEIAPNIGLADAIVDIVSSGSTLFKNGLKEVELILKSEAVLASSPKISAEAQLVLNKLQFRIQSVLRARKAKYILLNVPNDKILEISKILPVLKSPTVMPLTEPGWSSVHTVIEEDQFWEVIDELKAHGAEGILVCPIEKMVL